MRFFHKSWLLRVVLPIQRRKSQIASQLFVKSPRSETVMPRNLAAGALFCPECSAQKAVSAISPQAMRQSPFSAEQRRALAMLATARGLQRCDAIIALGVLLRRKHDRWSGQPRSGDHRSRKGSGRWQADRGRQGADHRSRARRSRGKVGKASVKSRDRLTRIKSRCSLLLGARWSGIPLYPRHSPKPTRSPWGNPRKRIILGLGAASVRRDIR